MRTFARLAAFAAAGLMLTGCLSVGQLARRGTTVDEGIGTLSNRAILINLARASRQEPLYFLTVTSVNGQGTTDLHLGDPQFLEGPTLKGAGKDFTFNGNSIFLDNSVNTQVQLGSPYSKDFYNGIMSPLGLDDVNLLLHQGFPRELVYYLVIDHAKFTNVDNPADSFVVYNDPQLAGAAASLPPDTTIPPTFAQFNTVMALAMTTGFVTEVTPPPDCSPAALAQASEGRKKACDKKEAVQQVGGEVANGAVQFVLQPKAEKGAGVRLCFERTMAVGLGAAALKFADAQADPERRPIYCGLEGERGAKQVVRLLNGQVYKIEIFTRSIYAIYQYLGRMMTPGGVIPDLVDYQARGEETPTGPIFVVNSSFTDCFAATDYRGRNYCVPNDSSGATTRQIFTMLNTLVALKQSPGDLPAAQTVLVAP